MHLNFLIERDEETWIAFCVEHDLVAHARTLEDLMNAIELLLITSPKPFQTKAPAMVRQEFELATLAITPLRPRAYLSLEIPSWSCRIIA